MGRTGLGILILAIFCALNGCGADNPPGSPGSGKIDQPRASQEGLKPQIMEILSDTQERGGAPEGITRREEVEDGSIEVFPPGKAGEPGVTLEQLKAMQAEQVQETNPRLIEVFPPEKPGERGMTLEQVETLQTMQREAVLEGQEVIPPQEPGQ